MVACLLSLMETLFYQIDNFSNKMLLQLLQIAQKLRSKYIITHFPPLKRNLHHGVMQIVRNSKHDSFPTPKWQYFFSNLLYMLQDSVLFRGGK